MFSARLLIILTGHQNNAEFMISRRVLWYRLYLVLNIAIVWVLFSLIFLYNIIEVDKEVLAQRRLSFFSLAFAIVGIIVAGAEAFFLKSMFRKFPIWLSTILRMTVTFTLFMIASVVVVFAYWIFRYDGELNFIQFEKHFVKDILLTPSFLMLMVDLGLLVCYLCLCAVISRTCRCSTRLVYFKDQRNADRLRSK